MQIVIDIPNDETFLGYYSRKDGLNVYHSMKSEYTVIQPCEDAYDKVLAYLKANVDDFPDYHEAIEAVLKMKGGA